jgi:small GTP-binding protein
MPANSSKKKGAKEVIKKICLLGDPAVGKTSLIRKYIYDVFDDDYIMTIGTKVTKKEMLLEKAAPDGRDINMTLLIWDILGQREHNRLHSIFYQGAEGAVLVCDITRKDTIMNLDSWVESFITVVGRVPLVFFVNKIDLKDPSDFDKTDIEEMSKKFKAPYFFTSAKTGDNVEGAFKSLSDDLAKTVEPDLD